MDRFFWTPHLDAFAADAMHFTRAYCTGPLCSPSRSSLMTGRWPHQTGVVRNGIPLREPTIAPRLQAAGYRTAYFGKWHLKDEPIATAGWDEQSGVCDEYAPPNRPMSDQQTLDAALDFIRRQPHSDRPFALFVSFDEPHGVYRFNPASGYPATHCALAPDDPAVSLPASWFDPSLVPACNDGADGEGFGMPDPFAHDGPAGYRVYRALYRDRDRAFDASAGRILGELRDTGLMDRSLVHAKTGAARS